MKGYCKMIRKPILRLVVIVMILTVFGSSSSITYGASVGVNVSGRNIGYNKTYVNTTSGVRHYSDTFRLWVDDEVAFCLQSGYRIPGFSSGGGDSYLTYASEVAGSDSIQNKIAYLGWYNSESQNSSDYAFTQMYIWESLPDMPASGNRSVEFSSAIDREAYENWKRDLNRKISRWDLFPSFDSKLGYVIGVDPGKTQKIEDTNGAIEDYENFQFEKNGVTVSHIKGEKYLTVTTMKSMRERNVDMSREELAAAGCRKYDSRATGNFIYSSDTAQNLGVYGSIQSRHMGLKIRVNTQEIEIAKTDKETGNPIPQRGAEFILESEGGEKWKLATDENGVARKDNLISGTYKVTEAKAPEGYIIAEKPLVIKLEEQKDGGIVKIPFFNRAKKGRVIIEKKGIYRDGFTKKEELLNNVVFDIVAKEEIKSFDGKTVLLAKGEVADTVITDAKGTATSISIPLGEYCIFEREIKSEKNEVYTIPTNRVAAIQLKYDGEQANLVTGKIDIKNEAPTTELLISKEDRETGERLAGAKIVILDENMRTIATGETDKNGIVKFENLGKGKYYYKEARAPIGYAEDSANHKFEAKKEGGTISATVLNSKTPAPKTDDSGNLIGYLLTITASVGLTFIAGTKNCNRKE